MYQIEQFLNVLKLEIAERGNQKETARQYGVSEQYLSDVLAQRREPRKKLLDAMGFKRVVCYIDTDTE